MLFTREDFIAKTIQIFDRTGWKYSADDDSKAHWSLKNAKDAAERGDDQTFTSFPREASGGTLFSYLANATDAAQSGDDKSFTSFPREASGGTLFSYLAHDETRLPTTAASCKKETRFRPI